MFSASSSPTSKMLRSQFFVFALLLGFTNLKLSKQRGCGGSPAVTIAQGTLRGRRNVTAQGTEYYMFLGIPYAAPPVGRLRFVAPQPPRRWQGVQDAINFGSPCNQVNDSSVNTGNEDCLFINVFTPELPCSRTTLLPVMVWIHGGGFVSGSGDIAPGHLLDREVVVVSFNYRLNVFGFLSVEGTEATGNAGLKDQVAALRWVRRNIAHFGGDTHSVTIFGESAGGASVHYHMLSPLSRGLFRRAISQSASALSPWAFNCSTQHNAYRLSYIVGRGANNTKDLVANLRATPARELISALSKVLTPEESTRILSFPFMPTMEYHRAGERPFLLKSPECIESAGSFYKVPYIIGVNLKEGALFTPETVVSQPSYWQNISNDIEQIVPLNLGLKKGSRLSLEVAGKIKEFYFGSKDISYENRNRWVELQSDLLFVLGVLTTLRSHARFSDFIKTYNYHFIYNNATHTDEIKYVFFTGKIAGGNANESIVAEHFGSMWTRFAKKGVPTSGDVFSWPPVSKNTYPFLQISTLLRLDKNLESGTVNFWTSIYRNYRQIGPCCS